MGAQGAQQPNTAVSGQFMKCCMALLYGRSTAKSAGSWPGQFMNGFADALHTENLTLTVFIGGCCGWNSPGRVCHYVPISTERAQGYTRS
jgi:hypothetical protein